VAPDLSICIVNWNGREIVRGLLRSIAATVGRLNVQTIIVDNASTDGSREMIKGEFPDVVLLRNSHNAGFARANNQAAACALGRYLLFLNNDTIVGPGAIATMVRFLDAHCDYVAAAPQLIGDDGRPQQTVRSLPTPQALLDRVLLLKWTRAFRPAYRAYRQPADFDAQRSSDVQQVAAAALMVRREAFEQCGRWDDGYEFGVEDVDLCQRLGKAGKFRYLAEAQIDHLGRVSSRANRPFVYRGYECGWARYLRKHHSAAAAWTYKTMVSLDMPVRIAQAAGAWAIKRIMGKAEQARTYRQRLNACASFMLSGLGAFWRA